MIQAASNPKSGPDAPEPPPKGASLRRRAVASFLFEEADLTPVIARRAYALYKQRVRDENQQSQDRDWLEAERAIATIIQRRRLILAGEALGILLILFAYEWDKPSILSELLIAVVVIVTLILTLILWRLAKLQAARSRGLNADNQFDRENEARKTLAQIIGGLLLLAGLYSSMRSLDLQREGQVTDRFTKASDQLGAVQSGGAVGFLYIEKSIMTVFFIPYSDQHGVA
ncbi:MAG: hypothetical protein QOH35_2990 [Acidobacteriaceae bacterium]|jgi:hypothetical protein|nr:hypothetical protein [Acidobacteriaceae bacterium]MEA2541624.1 hypothetical protein [Acidobacteriaceae bacterium]